LSRVFFISGTSNIIDKKLQDVIDKAKGREKKYAIYSNINLVFVLHPSYVNWGILTERFQPMARGLWERFHSQENGISF